MAQRHAADGTAPDEAALAALEQDPRYRTLLRRRSRFAWMITALMLAIYFGFILLIAFRRDSSPGRSATA